MTFHKEVTTTCVFVIFCVGAPLTAEIRQAAYIFIGFFMRPVLMVHKFQMHVEFTDNFFQAVQCKLWGNYLISLKFDYENEFKSHQVLEITKVGPHVTTAKLPRF